MQSRVKCLGHGRIIRWRRNTDNWPSCLTLTLTHAHARIVDRNGTL
jgi:hypothetical protein